MLIYWWSLFFYTGIDMWLCNPNKMGIEWNLWDLVFFVHNVFLIFFFLIVIISEKHTNYQEHCISGYYTVKSVAALCSRTTIQHKLNACNQCSGKYSLCIWMQQYLLQFVHFDCWVKSLLSCRRVEFYENFLTGCEMISLTLSDCCARGTIVKYCLKAVGQRN